MLLTGEPGLGAAPTLLCPPHLCRRGRQRCREAGVHLLGVNTGENETSSMYTSQGRGCGKVGAVATRLPRDWHLGVAVVRGTAPHRWAAPHPSAATVSRRGALTPMSQEPLALARGSQVNRDCEVLWAHVTCCPGYRLRSLCAVAARPVVSSFSPQPRLPLGFCLYPHACQTCGSEVVCPPPPPPDSG